MLLAEEVGEAEDGAEVADSEILDKGVVELGIIGGVVDEEADEEAGALLVQFPGEKA